MTKKEKKKLGWYIIYATGTPLVITGITAILQFTVEDKNFFSLPSDEVETNSTWIDQLHPQFGARKCFFDQDKKLSNFVLFYLPLLLIQITNIVFFSLTIFKISKTWQESGSLRMHNSENRNNGSVVVKVFLVMGINWLFEFLSFLAEWQWDETISKNLSYFSDMVNLLQGLLIFIVLICKPKILKKLREKIPISARLDSSPESSNGDKETKSSDVPPSPKPVFPKVCSADH
jgi:hypothetical protein